MWRRNFLYEFSDCSYERTVPGWRIVNRYTLKKEAVSLCDTSVNIHQNARRHISVGSSSYNHHNINLKSKHLQTRTPCISSRTSPTPVKVKTPLVHVSPQDFGGRHLGQQKLAFMCNDWVREACELRAVAMRFGLRVVLKKMLQLIGRRHPCATDNLPADTPLASDILTRPCCAL